MLRYQTYLIKGLSVTTLIVAVSLTSIVWLMQALRLVDFIVNQGIPVGTFLQLSLLLLPSLFMLVLPTALAIAIIHFYHKLKADSELTALQSAGLTRFQLAKPALIVAGGCMLIGYFLSLYLLPVSYKEFRTLQHYLRNNYVSVLLQEGVFSTPVEGLMVYVRERGDKGVLKGILVYDSRNPEASITMMAEEAQVAQTADGPRFMLTRGNRQELQKNGKLSFLEFDSYAFDMSVYAQAMKERAIDNRELPITELLAVQPENGQITPKYMKDKAEAHQRLIWPAYSLTLACIALVVLLTGEFNRRMRWQRNILASGLVVVMLLLAVGLKSAMTNNLIFVPLAYASFILPIALSLPILTEFKPGKSRPSFSLATQS